jgi:tetratricopeptide (TPR) repeat protein
MFPHYGFSSLKPSPMKKRIFAAIFLCLQIPAFCCLNYYYTADKDGHLHYQGDDDDIMIGFNMNFNLRKLSASAIEQEKKLKEDKSFEALSDYAVMLMKMGKNDVALTILQSLYAAHPDQYQLAANLGTSYELAGEVDSALKYIKRGIELNPNAHEGSEWVHVKILETKLKLRADSIYLKTHSVLELTPQQESDSLVGWQIEIQIRERFPFCPGPDAIMASLMEDFADITLNTNSIEDAKTYYNICKHYFGDSSANMENKIAASIKLIGKHSNVRPEHRRNPGEDLANYMRLGPYTYEQMLDDNNPDKFEVDWSTINTDAIGLLDIVGLKPVPPPIVTDSTSTNDQTANDLVSQPDGDDSSGSLWLIIAVASCCSVFVWLFWYKKRK